MRKTHAVDLDGTLATYDGYIPHHIGDPIPEMVNRISDWLANGDDVVIFTARVKDNPEDKELIERWTKKTLGRRLEVTNEKRPEYTEIWDDRAVAVQKNSGQILGADEQTGFSKEDSMNGVEKEILSRGRKEMPAKSGKQYRFMQMMAHSPEKSYKSTGPSPEVAREFIEKTPARMRSKFSKGLRKRKQGLSKFKHSPLKSKGY